MPGRWSSAGYQVLRKTRRLTLGLELSLAVRVTLSSSFGVSRCLVQGDES